MRRPPQLEQSSANPDRVLQVAQMQAPSAHNPKLLTRLKRILREMYALQKDQNPDVRFFPSEQEPGFWNVLLAGPEHTPYANFVFHMYTSFPSEYPRQPPTCRFVTPIYHCNVNADGRICHSIFDRNYSPSVSIREIFNHVFALLMTPEPKDPLDNARAA